MTSRSKGFGSESGKDKLRRRWMWITLPPVALILVLALSVVVVPVGLERGLRGWLLEQGMDSASVGDVAFSPVTGHVVIRNINAWGKGQEAISIGRVAATVDWLPLFKKRVRLRRLSISDSRIRAASREGVPLFAPGNSVKQRDSSENDGWGMGILDTSLEDIRITFSDGYTTRELSVVGGRMGRILSWEPERNSAFRLSLRVEETGVLELTGKANPLAAEPSFSGRIEARDLDLLWLGPHLEKLGVQAVTGKVEAEVRVFGGFDANRSLKRAHVQGTATMGSLGAAFESLGFELRQRTASVKGSFAYGAQGISANADIRAEGLQMGSMKKDHNAVSVKEFELRGLQTDGKAFRISETRLKRLTIDSVNRGFNVVSADEMRLTDFQADGRAFRISEARFVETNFLQRSVASKDADKKPSHILGLEKMVFRDITVGETKRTEIREVALQGAGLFLSRDAQGEVELLEWLDSLESANGEGSGSVSVAVGEVVVSGDSGIEISDRKVSPALRLSIAPFDARLGRMDTGAPEHLTPFELSAGIGKYSSLKAGGSTRIFSEKASMKMKGKLDSVALQNFAPYAAETLGYRTSSGVLDADFSAEVKEDVLDAEIDLVIGKLRLERTDKTAFTALQDVPFKKAMSMLRDRKDNIRLRVTVHGDLSDPQFDVHEVVRRALSRAVTEGAVSYFAPVGVTLLTGVTLPPGTLFLAKKLLQWATALRFDPVEFGPGDSRITEKSAGYLDELGSLLKDRPSVSLVVCGIATLADLEDRPSEDKAPQEVKPGEGAAPEEQPARDEKHPPEERVLPEEERERLLGLATQRAENIKDYLVRQGGIEAKRLVICSPELQESEEAPPRAEIGI